MKSLKLAFVVGLVAMLPAVSGPTAAGALDGDTAAAGLKEALQVGATRAAELLGREDGYLGDELVRIPVPDKLEFAAKSLRKVGMDRIVDEFETSLNRAAEAAAPLAKDVFVGVIRDMTFEDALEIVRGEQHEGTDYLRENAGPKLAEIFKPTVGQQLEAVGATNAFDQMMDRAAAIPFVDRVSFDLEDYVTGKALDGLFLKIAKEEERIRQDPLARTSDLLKKVFGGAAEGEEKRPWWKKIFGREE